MSQLAFELAFASSNAEASRRARVASMRSPTQGGVTQSARIPSSDSESPPRTALTTHSHQTVPTMSFDPAAVAEAESLRLVTFTSETAFDLGLKLREHIRAKYPGQPAIVDIRSAVSEQQLFFACCAEGSLPDNAWCAAVPSPSLSLGQALRRRRADEMARGPR